MYVVADGAVAPKNNFVLPFLLDGLELHGRLVRLGSAVDEIILAHDYPAPVAHLLAEALTLTAMLGSIFKYKGVLNLQIKGDGPVGLLVCDVTDGGQLRGYAKFDRTCLPTFCNKKSNAAQLLGEGYLAFTVESGPEKERYQGIVELGGRTLEQCAHHYFRQSVQFDAVLKIGVCRDKDKTWRTGGVMLQCLPRKESMAPNRKIDEAWKQRRGLVQKIKPITLYQSCISPFSVLFELFNGDNIRVYEAKNLCAKCSCSKERVELVLAALPNEEIESLKVNGEIVVTCEFCNLQTIFCESDLTELRDTGRLE